MPLEPSIRADVFALRPFRHRDRWWIPVPERDQPVFVVSVDEPPTDRSGPSPETLGLLMAPLRQRFEGLERGRRRAAMSVAAELQWDLLPVRADHGCGSSVAAVLEPAYDVAGDLFDHTFGASTWVYSFDGMGHGLAATTHASAALAAVRNRRRRGDDLAGQFEAAGHTVRELSNGGAFVTAVGCEVSADGDVQVVNAGHEPIRAVRGGGVSALDIHVDPPLGVGHPPSYRITELPPLGAGDGLVLLSDGAAGARTDDGGRLGGQRLDEIIAAAWCDVPLLTAQDIAAAVLAETVENVDDDITIVVVRHDGAAHATTGRNT